LGAAPEINTADRRPVGFPIRITTTDHFSGQRVRDQEVNQARRSPGTRRWPRTSCCPRSRVTPRASIRSPSPGFTNVL